MTARRTFHALTAALAVGGVLLSTGSFAADPVTFYLRQEGCGATAEAGRLDTKKGEDGATGCGTVGGLPIDEIIHQVEGSTPDVFDTGSAGIPHALGAGKITGQIAVGSWIGNGTGGVGTVTVDVALVGTTVGGASVDFGSVTADAPAGPGADIVKVPFELAIPGAAAGFEFKKFSLSVVQRGANLGMSAKQLNGDSFIVVPKK